VIDKDIKVEYLITKNIEIDLLFFVNGLLYTYSISETPKQKNLCDQAEDVVSEVLQKFLA